MAYSEARALVAHGGGWLERFTRIGFLAKGVVYLLIGVLALMSAFSNGGETTGKQGAVRRIAEQPFGEFALAVIAVGLFAYAFWRVLCAFANVEGERHDYKGAAKRVGYFISAVVYGGLAMSAIRLLTGNGGEGGDQTQPMTARLMGAPGGTLLVILAGLIVIAVGVNQIRNGVKEKFLKKLRTDQMSTTERTWARRAGHWGYAARGVVFGLMGVFLVFAGIRHNPGEARGLEGSLDTLATQPFGPWLLGAVALGLALYGAYCFVEARYRRIHMS